MSRYLGHAPIVRTGMSSAVVLVPAFIVALVLAFGVEVSLLLPHLNR